MKRIRDIPFPTAGGSYVTKGEKLNRDVPLDSDPSLPGSAADQARKAEAQTSASADETSTASAPSGGNKKTR